MQYLLMIYGNEAAMAAVTEANGGKMLAAYTAYAEAMGKAGVLQGGNRLRPTSCLDHRAGRQRQDHRARRPLCRDQGTTGRLLPHRRPRPRRRPLLGRALPRSEHGRGGGARRSGPCSAADGGADDSGPAQAAEAVARDSYGKLIAFLVARTGDMAGAEDALSDAFAAALAEWPGAGIPDNPRAWLATVARRKQIDQFRRRRTRRDASDHIALLARELDAARSDAAADPGRAPGSDVRLRASGDRSGRAGAADAARPCWGWIPPTIASAFLVAPATMGQRLVRAQVAHQAGGHSVSGAGTRRVARSSGRRVGRDLRRVRGGLVGSRRHRSPPPRPRRRGDLAWPPDRVVVA